MVGIRPLRKDSAVTATAPARTEPPRVKTRVIYQMTLIEFMIAAAMIAPMVVLLSLKVIELAPAIGKEFALSIVTVAAALASMVFTPIFGHLSDRTASRFGRRRPWILGGVVVATPFVILTALAGDVVTMALAWGAANIAYAASMAALYGMVSDRIPDEQRAKASGVFGAGSFAGMIPGIIIATALKDHLALAFAVGPIAALVVTAVVVPFLADRPVGRDEAARVDLASVFASLVFDPRKVPQFAWAWLQRFVMQFGYMTMSTFALYYLLTRLQMQTDAATMLTSVSALAVGLISLVAAFLCGQLASRRRDYTPFIVTAVLLLAAACLLKAFTASIALFWIANIAAGFALGCYYAVDLALVLRIVPAAESGRYLGVFNIAKTLPQSLAPAVAPFLLLVGGNADPLTGGTGNYLALYLFAAVLVLLSLLPLRRLTALRGPLVGSSGAVAPQTATDASAVAVGETEAALEPVPMPHSAPAAAPSAGPVAPLAPRG